MRKIISVSLAKIEDAKLLLKIHNASVKGGYFNSKKVALNAIRKHPEMILREKDFSIIKINI